LAAYGSPECTLANHSSKGHALANHSSPAGTLANYSSPGQTLANDSLQKQISTNHTSHGQILTNDGLVDHLQVKHSSPAEKQSNPDSHEQIETAVSQTFMQNTVKNNKQLIDSVDHSANPQQPHDAGWSTNAETSTLVKSAEPQTPGKCKQGTGILCE
jgi:hypothetical protein